MRQIKGLIFDLGNTLMYMDHDWDTVIARGAENLARFLANHGFELDPGTFAEDFVTLRRSLRAKAIDEQKEYTADYALMSLLAQMRYEDVSRQLVEGGVNAFFAFEETRWHAYPESEATLRQLSGKGYRLALISNATHDPLIQSLVDKGSFRQWLDVVLTSAGIGIRKPHPRIFHQVLDMWGFLPSQVVMIGDTLQFDILGAHSSGMAGILAAWDLYPDYAIGNDHIVPDGRADSLSELEEVIVGLDERVTGADEYL